MSEKDLISRFFDQANSNANTILGIGDDAAILDVPKENELVVSIDTLVAGVSFPNNTSAEDIGYKAMAVSLSDMAAMGATPTSALLSLSLPDADDRWLNAFSTGLFELINEYGMQLVGGDMSKGPLAVTTVVHGHVPKGTAICRHGARPGDLIYVTGTFGDAGLGLQQGDKDGLLKLRRPTPRVSAGIALRTIASAAIDVSDGLTIDLEKLCGRSNVGAVINVDKIPLHKVDIETALTAGDDFELCFTVPADQESRLTALNFDCPIHKIGKITDNNDVTLLKEDGTTLELNQKGYDHF